jgi:hypothetical protein
MCDYGCFPVYRPSSDLYLMDLQAAQPAGRYSYRRLSINSDASESWHSWSSNGRWIAFSSKRLSHLFTRTYLAYVDDQGTVQKPLLLPQKNSGFMSPVCGRSVFRAGHRACAVTPEAERLFVQAGRYPSSCP